MKVTYDKGKYICRCTFDERKIPGKAGFVFDPIIKRYVTSKVTVAARLRKHFDSKAKDTIRDSTVRKMPWSGKLSISKKIKIRDVQVKGCEFALTRNHSYIAYEQRLGKTGIGLTTFRTVYTDVTHPGLFIVPPNKILDWVEDFKEWVGIDRVLEIMTRDELMGFEVSVDYAAVFISDSLVTEPKIRKFIDTIRFRTLVVDEAHRFVNEGTSRTDAMFGTRKDGYSTGIVRSAERVILMSGTPMPNRPLELWPCIRALAHNCIDFIDFQTYAMRYCNGRMVNIGYGKEKLDATGASNLEELRDKLKPFMQVEKLKDHTKVMPKHSLVLLSAKVTNEADLDRQSLSKENLDYYMDNAELGDIATYRKELSLDKFVPALKYVYKEMKKYPDDRFLIVGCHTDLINDVWYHLGKSYDVGLITGKTTKKGKQEIKSMFQNDLLDAIVAQVETMQGIDLYKGNRVIFIESPWSPRAINQAALRIATIGKKDAMTVKHLVIKDTLEEYVLRRALEKQKNIDRVVV